MGRRRQSGNAPLSLPGLFSELFRTRRRGLVAALVGALGITGTVVVILAILLIQWIALHPRPQSDGTTTGTATTSGGVELPATGEGFLFWTWNVENLFDDEDDPNNNDELENWFGTHPEMVERKVNLIAAGVLEANNGLGPDILAVVEVENRRAVDLLRERLNAQLPSEWHYINTIHRDQRTGRRIEPAVITRLPILQERTRIFGANRMLEAHIQVAGRPLVVLVAHWTSRITDQSGAKRIAYAKRCYDAFWEHYQLDPQTDYLICGDFNDNPEDPSLRVALRAVADPPRTEPPRPPWLRNLSARINSRRLGTFYYQSRWQVLDHIVVAPGLEDRTGWQVLPDTFAVPILRGADPRPRKFGGPKEREPRGASDHRPLSVRLRIVDPS